MSAWSLARRPTALLQSIIESRSSSPGSSRSTSCSRSQWFCVSSPRNAASSKINTGASCPSPGNGPGLAAISRVFELREFFEWRGLGSIDHSGVRVRGAYARYDAERKFSLPGLKIADPKACQCGEVLKGVIKPWQCKVFGGACTPETPLGALMVSSEGACAAYYNYGGARVAERRRAAHPEAAE